MSPAHVRRCAAALTVTALVSACAPRGDAGSAGAVDASLVELRSAAALDSCRPGLSAALPDLTLPCLDGSPARPLRGVGTGTPTVVNVWASWCGPCVREVPELVAAAKAGAGRLDVVGVLTQDDERKGLDFAARTGMHYPSFVDDDGAVMRTFSPGPPVTVFLDGSGEVRYVKRGEITNGRVLEELVREHLGVDLTSPSSS